MNEFEELIKKGEMNLTLVIAEDELDSKDNTIYILEVDTNTNAAGGRGAGFGSRRFKKIHGFKIKDGNVEKIVESNAINDIDVGYVIRLPIEINGEEIVVSCSIDPEMISILNQRFKI